MNNCYGSNGDMQLAHIKVYPSTGEAYEAFFPVSDTDDTERQELEISECVDDNLQNVEQYDILYGDGEAGDQGRRVRYDVAVRVDGRYYVTVDASSLEEAKQKASKKAEDADFGELESIDWEVINATDPSGKTHDFV